MVVVLPILLSLVAGICVAVQAPTNAALGRAAGSTLLAALTSFALGTVVLAVAWALTDRTMPAMMKGAPGWAWVGGLYGAYFVVAAAYVAPRLGVASMITLVIAGQLTAAVLIDHFGLLGIRAEPISLSRIAGIALVIGGVILVRR